MRRAPPPTAMPTMAPVLRVGEEVGAAGALVVDVLDEEVEGDMLGEEAGVEVDVGREVIGVGEAEVANVEERVEDACLLVRSRKSLE